MELDFFFPQGNNKGSKLNMPQRGYRDENMRILNLAKLSFK